MSRTASTTRDDFEYWLIDMDDAIDRMVAELPADLQPKLDYSPGSLDVIESIILARYSDVDKMIAPDQARIVDGYARYIGETFRRNIGGHWDVDLENDRNVYFQIPVLTAYEENPTPIAPLGLATASADRRTGSYLRRILENIIEDKADAAK